MSDKIIQVENVSKWFGDFQALKDVNLEVSLKEKIVVCGPSGSNPSWIGLDLTRASLSKTGW